jgi:hypothetical protein
MINTLNLKAPTGGVAYGIFSKAKYDLFANVISSRPRISPLGSCTSGSAICLLIVQINRVSTFFKTYQEINLEENYNKKQQIVKHFVAD